MRHYPEAMSDAPGEQAQQRQRVAAYAVCVRDGAVLLTQLSTRTSAPGLWTLPGGGIDHGEHPRDAVVREFDEETSLPVRVGPLLDVDSVHHVGRSPFGTLEDYHSLRLIFAGWVDSDATPTVREIDGSTAACAWIKLSEVADGTIEVTQIVHAALIHLADLTSRTTHASPATPE